MKPSDDQAGARGLGVHLRVVDQRDAAFLEIATRLAGNVIERRAETGDQRHRRRVGALALDRVLALLAQIEVVARILDCLHRRPRLLAHAQVREAGRNHHRLLRAADEHVDAPAIHVEVRGAEAGDAVDNQQRVGRDSWTDLAIASTSWRTAVEVSVACMKTALCSGLSAART